MDSRSSVSRHSSRGQESRRFIPRQATSAFPKPQRVDKLVEQREQKRTDGLPPPSPPSARVSIPHSRSSRRLGHGCSVTMISTVIQGRLLISPWPDDPAEDPTTKATKSYSKFPSSTSMKAEGSGRAVTTDRTSSSTTPASRQLIRNRMSATGSSLSAAPQPDNSLPLQYFSTIRDKGPQDDHHKHMLEDTLVDGDHCHSSSRSVSLSNGKEWAHDNKTRTTGTPTTASPSSTRLVRLGGSRSTQTFVRRGGGGDESQPSSSVESVESFNLEAYRPLTTKARRTAGQILEEMVGDSDTGVASSSIPSVTSSAALAAGLEDIEGYLEEDLRGFSKLSY